MTISIPPKRAVSQAIWFFKGKEEFVVRLKCPTNLEPEEVRETGTPFPLAARNVP